jgi:hypothetical protein
VCGYRILPGAAKKDRPFSDSLSDKDYALLAERSHYGRANAHVMDVEVPATSTSPEKFQCDFLHAWNDVPERSRNKWIERWKTSFPLLEKRLECGDNPLHIERDADISDEGRPQKTRPVEKYEVENV